MEYLNDFFVCSLIDRAQPRAMSHHHNFEFDESTQANLPKNKYVRCLKSNSLTLATVAGVLIGGIIGIILRSAKTDWTQREIMYIGFLGQLFLRMLKTLILPLIISSLVSAIAGLDLSLSSKIATRAIAYYLTTTFCSVVLGIAVVVAIRPGHAFADDGSSSGKVMERTTTTADTLLDLIR